MSEGTFPGPLSENTFVSLVEEAKRTVWPVADYDLPS